MPAARKFWTRWKNCIRSKADTLANSTFVPGWNVVLIRHFVSEAAPADSKCPHYECVMLSNVW